MIEEIEKIEYPKYSKYLQMSPFPNPLMRKKRDDMMSSEIPIVKVSLKKPIEKFGHWLVEKMDHSGLPLYLILHSEEIEILSGAKPVGLEVNLPTGVDVYTGVDKLSHGRKKARIDLVFEKGGNYYLVEVKDKSPTSKELEKLKEYVEHFRENLGSSEKIRVFPIIVCPQDSTVQAFWELYR